MTRFIAIFAAASAVVLCDQDKNQKKIVEGIAWAKSWDEAKQEAELRNAPIHITMHKDN